jgi:hypothetical protein
MSDLALGGWSVPESPVAIEYSLDVIEEIRYAVAEGFQKLSRGGLEVGGILYGSRDGRTVRILGMRPVECEHARGPAFLLSDKDKAALTEQLGSADPRLEDMIPVGWFLSHTRSEIALSESDVELYSLYFPAPWQVTLVVRPGRGGIMRAGFFVREADGTLKTERSYMEFNFPDRLASVLDPPPRGEGIPGERVHAERVPGERVPRERVHAERVPGDRVLGERASIIERRGSALPKIEPTAAPVAREPERPTATSPSFEPPELLPEPTPRRKWPWIAVLLVLLVTAAVLVVRYYMNGISADPLALAVLERDGQLLIEWNHNARTVNSAVRGALEIVDGKESRSINLQPADLARGKFTWERKSGDVEVRLSVQSADGAKTQEASRFLGRPPLHVDSSEMQAVKEQRDALQAEVDRLRSENTRQTQRIQQLERTLRILQARLGIDTGKQ